MLRNGGRNGCSVVHRECLLLAGTLTVHACTDKNVPCRHWLRISSCHLSTKALTGSCATVSVMAEKSRSRTPVVEVFVSALKGSAVIRHRFSWLRKVGRVLGRAKFATSTYCFSGVSWGSFSGAWVMSLLVCVMSAFAVAVRGSPLPRPSPGVNSVAAADVRHAEFSFSLGRIFPIVRESWMAQI